MYQSNESESESKGQRVMDLRQERYIKLKRIGRGTFGDVFEGFDKVAGKPVAIKILDFYTSTDELEDTCSEINSTISKLMDCNCNQLLRLFETFAVGLNLWVVMEYCELGSLEQSLDIVDHGIDEAYVAVIVKEVLKGLVHLHENQIVHRAVKAANILVTASGDVKLTDFGILGHLGDVVMSKSGPIRCPHWNAPEVILQGEWDESADIWSLGITAIELASGCPPYASVHPMRSLLIITKQKPPTLEGNFSWKFKDFVKLCLQKDPAMRPRASELLKHEFVSGSRKVSCLKDLFVIPSPKGEDDFKEEDLGAEGWDFLCTQSTEQS
eukprot:TRINITY_DN8973_c0_g2_i4.p1 TRINITY_DN8973_c0_g2~~TRINITY_DN8973_c0_g2_i4.p1  ORF type:complete len:326 (+),score=82.04 TRINITY_DN8973_c0_g2_i4:66-1043(+)